MPPLRINDCSVACVIEKSDQNMSLGGEIPLRAASLGKRALRGMAWSMGSQATTAALSLLSFTILGRVVTPDRFGDYLMALVGIASIQWLSQSVYREPAIQARHLTKSSQDSIFWLTVGVGLLQAGLACIVALGIWKIAGRGNVAICMTILSLKLMFDTVVAMPVAMQYRSLRFDAIAQISVLASLTGCGLSIYLLLHGWDILGLAIAQVAGSATLFFLSLARCGWKPGFRFHWVDLKVLRHYSPHVLLWQLIETVNLYFDRFMVGTRLSSHALGVYGFGRRLNDIVIETLVGAVANVTLPAFATIQHDLTRVRDAYLRAVSMIGFLIFPLVVLLFINAADFIPLVFGIKWGESVQVYQWFLLLGALAAIGTLQATLIRSLGQARLWSRYQLMQAVANVVVVLIAINYGIVIIAAAVVVRSYCIWGFSVHTTCQLIDLKIPVYLKILARPLLWAIACGVVAVTVAQMVADLNVFARVAVRVSTGATTYALLAWLFMQPTIREFGKIVRA